MASYLPARGGDLACRKDVDGRRKATRRGLSLDQRRAASEYRFSRASKANSVERFAATTKAKRKAQWKKDGQGKTGMARRKAKVITPVV